MEPNTSLSRSPKPNIQLPLSSYFLPFSTMITALLYNWKEISSLKPALSFMFQPPISCKFRSANGIMDLNRAISDHRHGSVPCPLDHRHGSCPGTCCVSRSPSVHFQSPCFPPNLQWEIQHILKFATFRVFYHVTCILYLFFCTCLWSPETPNWIETLIYILT